MTRYILTGLLTAGISTLLLSGSASADHRGCDNGYSIRSYAVPTTAGSVQHLPSARYYYPQTYYYSYGTPYYSSHHHHSGLSFGLGLYGGHHSTHYSYGHGGGHYSYGHGGHHSYGHGGHHSYGHGGHHSYGHRGGHH